MNKRSRVKSFGLAAVAIIFVMSFIKQEITKKRLDDEKTKVEQQMESLKKENVELTEEIENSKSDAYVERLARERLGMIKKGEQVIISPKSE